MQHSHHFHGQMSDTFRAAVFANAQTGNIVLLSAALLRGD